jgi:methionine-rich copper-binding protein CopC
LERLPGDNVARHLLRNAGWHAGERDGSFSRYDVVGARVRYLKGSALRLFRPTWLCAALTVVTHGIRRHQAATNSSVTGLKLPRVPRPAVLTVWRAVGRVLLLAVVSGTVMTAIASPASAHGQLAMSTPAKDSTVTAPMESIALYFTEQPVTYAYFTLTAPSGFRIDKPWSPGESKRLDEPIREFHLIDGVWEPRLFHVGYPAKIPVAYWPEQGVYTAGYRTVASDGEEVRGELRFTYMGTTSARPNGWRPPTNEPDAALLAVAGHSTSPPAALPQAGVTTPQAGCTPVTLPETGCTPASASQTGVAQGAPQAESGTGVLVWLLPAVLVAGAGFMVVRAARRPSPAGGATRRPPTGPGPRKPPARAPAGRKPKKATKRR